MNPTARRIRLLEDLRGVLFMGAAISGLSIGGMSVSRQGDEATSRVSMFCKEGEVTTIDENNGEIQDAITVVRDRLAEWGIKWGFDASDILVCDLTDEEAGHGEHIGGRFARDVDGEGGELFLDITKARSPIITQHELAHTGQSVGCPDWLREASVLKVATGGDETALYLVFSGWFKFLADHVVDGEKTLMQQAYSDRWDLTHWNMKRD